MNRAFRLLPALGLGLLVVFAIRAGEVWTGFSAIGKAWAEGATKPDAHSAPAPAAHPTTPVAESKLQPPKGATPTDQGLPALNPPKALAPATALQSSHGSDAASADPANPETVSAAAAGAPAPTASRPAIPGEESFTSPAEIEVLESLSKRREELDKREAALDMREKLMATTEQRLDQKLAEIQKVEASIKASMKTLSAQEETQIQSLVKVYEGMKPKDAAAILQGLDRGILIQVAARMKDMKMSAILAAMDPDKAREVTVLLAKRVEVPGLGTTGAVDKPNP
jgi:flagellar motility protein MotE (MotC chaperone)